MTVFLSHANEDRKLVELVFSRLTAEKAWYDAVEIANGDNIVKKISEGIQRASSFVVFWSKSAKESGWVEAEMGAGFINSLHGYSSFFIFQLDNTELPLIYRQFRAEKIDLSDIENAVNIITKSILENNGNSVRAPGLLDRYDEIKEIESAWLSGKKIVILQGILGIGKSSLARKAFCSLHGDNNVNVVEINFRFIPSLPELAIALSSICSIKMPFNGIDDISIQNNVKFFFEQLVQNRKLIILRDINGWLNDDGSFNKDFGIIIDTIENLHNIRDVVIITSTRFVKISPIQTEFIKEIYIKGMEDIYISSIIKQNLSASTDYDENKNMRFAEKLYGYPLAARYAAHYIDSFGYMYYLDRDKHIEELRVELAKELIGYTEISKECIDYLEIAAICDSRLYSSEYCTAFPEIFKNSEAVFEEAYTARLTKYVDGRYELEPIVVDYFRNAAIQNKSRKMICNRLGKFIEAVIPKAAIKDKMRLWPLLSTVYTLNGKAEEAYKFDESLIKTIVRNIWDLYNSREYGDALDSVEKLLKLKKYEDNDELNYIKAKCLLQDGHSNEAKEILKNLIDKDTYEKYKYLSELGRLERQQGEYILAIDYYKASKAASPMKGYLAAHKGLASCYIDIKKYSMAEQEINEAKQIARYRYDIFLLYIEAQLYEATGQADRAVSLLSQLINRGEHKAQTLFRIGRAYDSSGNDKDACKYYKQAIEESRTMYNAQLCLLHHAAFSDSEEVDATIEELKKKLHGKRRAILSNIEARRTGFYKKQYEEATEILEKVHYEYRDRQWYKVMIDLLDKMAEQERKNGASVTATVYGEKGVKLQQEYKKRFNEDYSDGISLLPEFDDNI